MESATSRRLTVLALVSIVAATAATTSHATFPGKNGLITFRRYLGPNQTRGRIFTIGANGRHERRVTRPPAGATDEQPDWSPRGSFIAFRRERGSDGAVYTVRPDGSQLTRISSVCHPSAGCEENFTPQFSPDGRTLAYASLAHRKWSIVLVDLSGKTVGAVVKPESRAALDGPQFAPDGRHLIFVQHILHGPGAGRRAVFEVSLDGSRTRRVTPWRLAGGDNPDWSPNGKWILFRSNEDLNKQSQMYVIHPDGTGLKQLTHLRRGTTLTSSTFSPDGRWIVFGTSGLGGNADLFVMRRNGTGIRPVTRTRLWDSAPDWGPAR